MTMAECPWYVSAHAVRRWMEVTGARLAFDDASDRLIEICADTWRRYAAGDLRPGLTNTGAYVYRASRPHGRIRLIVVMERRPEGDKPQLVDVLR